MPRNILPIYTLYIIHIPAEIYKAVYNWGIFFHSNIFFLTCYFWSPSNQKSQEKQVKKKVARVYHREALPRSLNSRLESQSWSFTITYMLLSSSATLLQCYLFPFFLMERGYNIGREECKERSYIISFPRINTRLQCCCWPMWHP